MSDEYIFMSYFPFRHSNLRKINEKHNNIRNKRYNKTRFCLLRFLVSLLRLSFLYSTICYWQISCRCDKSPIPRNIFFTFHDSTIEKVYFICISYHRSLCSSSSILISSSFLPSIDILQLFCHSEILFSYPSIYRILIRFK